MCVCVCAGVLFLKKVTQMESSRNICVSENVMLWPSRLNDRLSVESSGFVIRSGNHSWFKCSLGFSVPGWGPVRGTCHLSYLMCPPFLEASPVSAWLMSRVRCVRGLPAPGTFPRVEGTPTVWCLSLWTQRPSLPSSPWHRELAGSGDLPHSLSGCFPPTWSAAG